MLDYKSQDMADIMMSERVGVRGDYTPKEDCTPRHTDVESAGYTGVVGEIIIIFFVQ